MYASIEGGRLKTKVYKFAQGGRKDYLPVHTCYIHTLFLWNWNVLTQPKFIAAIHEVNNVRSSQPKHSNSLLWVQFSTGCIRSNLPVAQNKRFVIYPVSPGGGTMIAKIWILGSMKAWKCTLQDLFSLNLPQESSNMLCLHDNFLEYPPNITKEF